MSKWVKTMTPAALAATRASAKLRVKRTGPQNINLTFRELCRARDASHVAILENIAANDPRSTARMTAIDMLWNRGHGRPMQTIEGQGLGATVNILITGGPPE